MGLLWALTPGPVAHAQAPDPSAFSLTISPTRLVVNPGQLAADQTFIVANRGSTPLTVTVSKTGFTSGPDGSPDYQQNAPYSAATWVTVTPTQFTVPATTSRRITVSITVPSKPEPGDHQVALIFLVPAGRDSANIAINRGIGTPVYITVPGPVDRSAVVSSLKAPGFVTGGAVKVDAVVKDTGTVHRDFRAPDSLAVHVDSRAVAFPDFTVLRGSQRNISTTWHAPLICVCHAKVSITGNDGVVSSREVRIIVFPVPLALGVLGGLILLALLWFLLRRSFRSRVIRAANDLGRQSTPDDA